MVFFRHLGMTSRGNHDNHCLLSMIFLNTIPNFKFLAFPILEILSAGLLYRDKSYAVGVHLHKICLFKCTVFSISNKEQMD